MKRYHDATQHWRALAQPNTEARLRVKQISSMVQEKQILHIASTQEHFSSSKYPYKTNIIDGTRETDFTYRFNTRAF